MDLPLRVLGDNPLGYLSPAIGWFCECGRRLEYDRTLGWGCGACGTRQIPVPDYVRALARMFEATTEENPEPQ